MRATRLSLFVTWGALLAGGAAAAGCNAVIGLDKLSIDSQSNQSTTGSDGTTTSTGSGSSDTTGSTGAASSGSTGGDTSSGGSSDGGLASSAGGDAASDAPAPECATNAECTSRATAQAMTAAAEAGADGANPEGGNAPATVPAVCVHPAGKCVPLLSDDCNTITGDYLNDDAIVVGSLFSTKGSQAATNLPRQQSAVLAVEEINAVGGVPHTGDVRPHPLVLVSCDESTNLLRAGSHLVQDLHVPAIVGPNTSQDTLDLSNKVSVPGGTVLMSPTAVASSISDLIDNGLTWIMVPSDVQRAPLMIQQINAIESQLRADRQRDTIKLGIVFRNDALGIGTRTSLNQLTFNHTSLTDPINAGSDSGNVKIDGYDFKQPNQNAIVSKYVDFAPDIVVLAGTAEAVTQVMSPLETQWKSTGGRPYYVLIDSAKVPELLTAITGNDDLRHRVRGTGVTPGADSIPVYNAFDLDYRARFQSSPSSSGTGPSYDAMYSIAYAMASVPKDQTVSGATISTGLRKLAGGSAAIAVGNQQILSAFQKLSSGESIDGVGTFVPLEWDSTGNVAGGTIEMWCIGVSAGTPVFQSSGLTFDTKTQQSAGTYTQCAP